MRQFIGSLAVLSIAFFAVGCSDLSESLLPEVPEDESPTEGPAGDISDATTDGRPYFFFLNPFTHSKLKPNQVGVFDPTLEPVVTICPLRGWDPSGGESGEGEWDFGLGEWDPQEEACNPGGELVEYSGEEVELILSAEKYQVVYKSQEYPLDPDGLNLTYRVSVSIYGEALGWADMALYDPDVPDHAGLQPGDFTLDDVLLLNENENQNISFRIDEGALEAQFCDPATLEDCDVAFVDPDGGILRVLDDGQPETPALGAIVTFPSGILGPDGLPYPDKVPVVLELEYNDIPQPSLIIPAERQYPYFIDVWTPINGLHYPYVDESSPGANILVCQEEDPGDTGFLPESLHDFLVLFLVRTAPDGTNSTELLSTTTGFDECEGLEAQLQAAADNRHDSQPVSLLSRVAAGLSRVSRMFLPQPLYAKRRLHGGLNTVVWEISGDDGETRRVSGLEPAGDEPELLQFGSILNVSADATTGTVTVPDPGFVGEPSTITVQALDAAGLPFLFEVDVTMAVTGANDTTVTATYDPTEMKYSATYIPAAEGLDQIYLTLEKEPFLPATDPPLGPFTSEIRLVKGPLTAQVRISDPAPDNMAGGYPIELYTVGGVPVQSATTESAGIDPETGEAIGTVTFDLVTYGLDYTVHLANRDFDVEFSASEYTQQVIGFDKTSEAVVFNGTTLPDFPTSVRVYRLGANGTGNAYEYVPEGRSWTAARNQLSDDLFYGVQGYLATIYNVDEETGLPMDALNEGENGFLASFLSEICSADNGGKQCRVRGWLGLSDAEEEGTFVWVTGEAANWFNWASDEPSDKKENMDHVEIAPDGSWSVINGASSTNDGYLVERAVPEIPPAFGGLP